MITVILSLILIYRALRRILGPSREEVTEGLKMLHNEELYGVCASPNSIRVMK
jgi:hypothetical protein